MALVSHSALKCQFLRYVETTLIFVYCSYGQQKFSRIYRFIAAGTLERKIYDRQVHKQVIADAECN